MVYRITTNINELVSVPNVRAIAEIWQPYKVDVLNNTLSPQNLSLLRLLISLIALIASIIFLMAGIEATSLYFKLGQVMELEIEIPIWWVYLAFPTGFLIMAIFALELVLSELLALLNGRDT